MTTETTNIRATVRSLLKSGITDANKAAATQARMNTQRDGAYTSITKAGAALAAEDAAQASGLFDELWEGIKADIRVNRGGIAKATGCKKGKGKQYKVPSAASSAASVIGDALRFGLGFTNGDGEPLAFSAIRERVQEAKEARRLDAMPGEARTLHDELSALRDTLAEWAQAFDYIVEGEMTGEALAAIRGAAEQVSGFNERLEFSKLTADDEPAEDTGEAVAAEAEADDKPATRRRAG